MNKKKFLETKQDLLHKDTVNKRVLITPKHFLHEILAHSKDVIHDVKPSEMSRMMLRHRDNTDNKQQLE
jgi:hypothetical protein